MIFSNLFSHKSFEKVRARVSFHLLINKMLLFLFSMGTLSGPIGDKNISSNRFVSGSCSKYSHECQTKNGCSNELKELLQRSVVLQVGNLENYKLDALHLFLQFR